METTYLAETDHLGSLIGLTDTSGVYEERYSYDAWGRRPNPSDWSFVSVPVATITDRGFTGHEHLDEFRLINMGGRLFNPLRSRFLNSDPVIDSRGTAQGLNSYTYCLNNPLKYTDPTGYILDGPPEEITYQNPGWLRYAGGGHSSSSWFEAQFEAGSGGGGGGREFEGIRYDAETDTWRNLDGTILESDEVLKFINSLFEGSVEGRWLTLGVGKPTLWVDEHPDDSYYKNWGMYIMHIIVYGTMYSDYNWVQTRSWDGGIQIVENGSMANNGFHYPQSESGKIAYGKDFYQGNGNMFFFDAPNASSSFFAELSLFGKMGESWYLIQSFTWGYSVNNGKTIGDPLTIEYFPSSTQELWIDYALFHNNPIF